jgi:hypothetical protein
MPDVGGIGNRVPSQLPDENRVAQKPGLPGGQGHQLEKGPPVASQFSRLLPFLLPRTRRLDLWVRWDSPPGCRSLRGLVRECRMCSPVATPPS